MTAASITERITLALGPSPTPGMLRVTALRGEKPLCSLIARLNVAHSEILPQAMLSVVAAARLQLADIDLFIIHQGQENLTGFRVGLASVQGLADALGKTWIACGPHAQK